MTKAYVPTQAQRLATLSLMEEERIMKIRGWIAKGTCSGYCGHMHKSREAARRCCIGDQQAYRVYENTQEILDDPREDAALAAVVEDAISQPSQVPACILAIRRPR